MKIFKRKADKVECQDEFWRKEWAREEREYRMMCGVLLFLAIVGSLTVLLAVASLVV